MTESRFQPIKAYKNLGFLNSKHARSLRILAEYLEPASRFAELDIQDTIVVFGSARIPSREVAEADLARAKKEGGDVGRAEKRLEMSRYYEDTRELCRRLTEWSKGLAEENGVNKGRRFVVCSGGGPGIMEAANRGASEARGENIGLNISLPFEQNENPYITRRLTFEFHYFFMRKFWFSYLAKAFVIMPGGFGTLDEFLEVVTLIQTLKIKKKVAIVLYGSDYWSRILNFEPMVEMGTVSAADLDLFHSSDTVDDAFEHITAWLREHSLAPEEAPPTDPLETADRM